MADNKQHRAGEDISDASSGDRDYDEKNNLAQEQVHDVQPGDVRALAEKLGDSADHGLAPMADLEWVMDKIKELHVDECKVMLAKLLKDHEHDFNFSEPQREKIRALIKGPLDGQSVDDWEIEIKSETAINVFFSPYPEVRAVTTPVDDTTRLCETWRAYLLGIIWAGIGQFVNSLFNSRFPSITIIPSTMQVLLYPCGKLLQLLPDWSLSLFGYTFRLNPGPWTDKEQMLATIMIDVGYSSAYCYSNIQTQAVYYKDTWLTPEYGILLLLSTQMMGLGFAGFLRRFVVYPVECFWPSQLATLALNRTLLLPEKKDVVHGWSISRYKFFWICFAAMFCYYWLPDFIIPAISLFPWMTWIAPQNFNLAVVTGSQLGLGFNPISSFDWNVFTNGNGFQPLLYPFFSMAQQYAGFFLSGLVILWMYFTNYKWTGYLPINSSATFDNTGQQYNVTRVVVNGVLDEEAYKQYSPAYYTAANLYLYGAFFAYYPMTFVFILLDSWRSIGKAYRQSLLAAWMQIKGTVKALKASGSALLHGRLRESLHHLTHALDEQSSVYDGFDDPFTNMMRAYLEVPDWWFLAILLLAFAFGLVIMLQFDELATPVWTLFFVIGLNFVFLVPMTYLYAISGTTAGLNVLTELIVGYALPGHPDALMLVKAYGYNINGQADFYTQDQKMGMFAKIPPRAIFRSQLTSCIATALICYGVVTFADTDIKGICTPHQAARFTCLATTEVFFSASIVWGAIGPHRIFDQIYPELKWAFLAGAVVGLVWWAGKNYGGRARRWLQAKLPSAIFTPFNLAIFTPLSWLQNVHPSLLVVGGLNWAPSNLTYATGSIYVSIVFQWWLRRSKTAWWEKYTYVLSAALTGGLALSAIIIFFALDYSGNVTLSWWGTDVNGYGIDGGNGPQSLYANPAEPNGIFGPLHWY